jgi:hypothetical protein
MRSQIDENMREFLQWAARIVPRENLFFVKVVVHSRLLKCTSPAEVDAVLDRARREIVAHVPVASSLVH